MKTRKHALASMVAVALFGAVPLLVHARIATPAIDQRQSNQAARIAKGEQTGALSKREAARMKAGQQKVADVKAGKVTSAERKAIKREQNKQSRRIARQKLDGNKR
jgi:hypothetical protein